MAESKSEYTLELLVKAEDWERAVTVLKYHLKIQEKQRTNTREIDGLFMVSIKMDSSKLTQEFYDKIKKCDELAIIADEASVTNARLINEKVYEVEMQLRRLLLHVSDLVEAFVKLILANAKYAKDFSKSQQIISPEHYEPVTSHMMLGELITILTIDLSWNSKTLTVSDLQTLFDQAKDLQEVQKNLKAKTERKTVWDLINQHMFDSQVAWKDISKQLENLRKYRNDTAHFLVITTEDKDDAIKKADDILSKIKIKKALSKQQKNELKSASSNYADMVNRLLDISLPTVKDISQTALASFYQNFKTINESSLDHLIATHQQAISSRNSLSDWLTPHSFPSEWYKELDDEVDDEDDTSSMPAKLPKGR